jgi:hypothetical protein
MRPHRIYLSIALVLGSMLALTLKPGASTNRPYVARVLHNFNGGGENVDGALPQGRLIVDATGALYGTTLNGGGDAGGTIFKLVPPPAGQFGWNESVLYAFHAGPNSGYPNGGWPNGGLAMDTRGALYGTTLLDGSRTNGSQNGTVFKLTPPAAGQTTWTQSTLHTFSYSAADGYTPIGDLIGDARGNLYGTTKFGGNFACQGNSGAGCGVIFELLAPAGSGPWTEKIIHFFSGPDGARPGAGLLADAHGAIVNGYCVHSCGTVYKLTPPAMGQTQWSYSVLHFFSFIDGAAPGGNLVQDALGELFGTTMYGGPNPRTAQGVVFKLAPPLPGQTAWTASVLHAFNYSPPTFTPTGNADGNAPTGVVTEGGHLYGTTSGGGSFGIGVYFMLTPPAAGQTGWTEQVLHMFDGVDGESPSGPLHADGRGSLYGLALNGGLYNDNNGTAFKLTHW